MSGIWEVEMTAIVRGTVEVVASNEEEAIALAKYKGMELGDISEIESSEPKSAEFIQDA